MNGRTGGSPENGVRRSHNLSLSSQRWLLPRCPGRADLAQRAVLQGCGVRSLPATSHGSPGTGLAGPCQAASSTRAGICCRDKVKNCIQRENPKKGRQEGGGKGKEMEGTWRGLKQGQHEMKVPRCSGLYLRGHGCQEAQGRLTSDLTLPQNRPAAAADLNPCPEKQAGCQPWRKERGEAACRRFPLEVDSLLQSVQKN